MTVHRFDATLRRTFLGVVELTILHSTPLVNRGLPGDYWGMRDEAIGAYEAAGVLGVHFTQPGKFAERGVLSSRVLSANGDRSFSVYSLKECEENFRDYQQKRSSSTGGRPRTSIDARPETLRRLMAKKKPVIDYGDAIGVDEAARILGVFWTLIPRLVREGKIVGRILWSERADRSRLWIISRVSAEARAAEVKKQESAGTKRGRPRLRVDL